MNPLRHFARCTAILSIALPLVVARGSDLLPPGFRPLPLGTHALVGGTVVVRPGESIDGATIVIRDGLIQAVGTNVPVPVDARVWDLKGLTVYAGFIDSYLVQNSTNRPISTVDSAPISSESFTAGGFRFFGAPGVQTDEGNPGPGYGSPRITPEIRAVEKYSPKDTTLAPLRELGFTAGVIAPGRGIVRGTSALVSLSDDNPNRTVIKPDTFQHIAFETDDNDAGIYPCSLMGVIATIRQSFFDAQHYALDHADYAQHTQNRKRPEFNPALEALPPARKTSVMFEPGSALMDDRAAQLSRELQLDFCLVSCGQEWRRPDLAKATGATFIAPLDFPTLPKLPDEDDWDQVSLDQLRAWDWAPENPALLRQQGLSIALTTYALADKKSFRKNLRLAIDRGLSETDALAALTTVPAGLCGVADRMGTIEPGKLADFVIVDGKGYFDLDSKVRAVWIDGRIYPVPSEEPKSGEASEAKAATAESTRPGDSTPPKEEPEKSPKPPSITERETQSTTATNVPPETKKEEKSVEKKNQLRELQKKRTARSPLEDRGPIAEPESLLIRDATLWTCGPLGVLTNAQLLVTGGKIKAIEASLRPNTNSYSDLMEVDGRGLFVTPGVIDCHSHTAILGDVNEPGLPSTAMVRISDVVNSETDNFHEQLAGGVTAVNLLHGSANPIGGQNCVIKLRAGASPEDLIFTNAPPGIKFALGENVKQSNWGEKFVTRFPQTRMGVQTFVENRFIAAQEYLKQWQNYRQNGGLQPRRDLELEAIGEIIQDKRWIHCHAYRQDEMLMLIRLMQSFGVQIATFQHALEGYKIADEMAAAKIGGSTFSDWWAYKFEVYDAIPFNGSLMRERGIVVSYNSDSSDLARRLYLEAAKAVKDGGTPEVEALKFVTLNPAIQLRIDKYVGSLEPGKDADFAIWSKPPLDSRTMCLQTWIEGKKYFDRAVDAERAARLKSEREELIAKAKQISKLSNGGDSDATDKGKSFFRVSLEHQYDHVDRHCLDGLSQEGE